MNEQLQATLRAALFFLGGLAVSRGLLTDEQLAWGVGGIIAAGTLGWTWWKNRPAGILKSATKLEAVQDPIVVTDQALADKSGPGVVGPKEVIAARVNAANDAQTGTGNLY